MTGNELAALVLAEIGWLQAGDTPSGDDAEDVRKRANLLIDELFLDRQWLHTVNRVTKTLTASTASYTIGSGGAINTVRPTRIDPDAARLVINTGASTPTETPIQVFTDQEWQDIAQKSLTSALPQGIYYDHNWSAGLGTISPWPIPNVGTTQLVLYLPGVAVTAFADLTTDYTMAPGYQSALVSNLAKRLTTPYGKALGPELVEWARESLARVKRGNSRHSELHGERILPGRFGGGYSIFTNR